MGKKINLGLSLILLFIVFITTASLVIIFLKSSSEGIFHLYYLGLIFTLLVVEIVCCLCLHKLKDKTQPTKERKR